jgi:hypothetical protein
MSLAEHSPYGQPVVDHLGVRKPHSAKDLTALKALAANDRARTQGNQVFVEQGASRWYWHDTSTLTGDDVLVATPADAPTAGRWLRCPGAVDLALPIAYTMADATTLLTMPANARMFVQGGYWEVTTAFSGGSSSAIGLSSDQTGHSTKGDLLGGGSGDIAATLAAGIDEGTIGADIAAGVVLKAGKLVRYDKVTSTFTAGAGYAHLVGILLANPGV